MQRIINNIKKNKYIYLLIILYIFFFFQMQLIHFYGDDYQVLYPINGNRNFWDILNFCLNKMSYFWNEWSGRIVGHFTVSFGLSMFGIQFFRIINPIMIFIMIFLSLKILQLITKFDFTKYLFYFSLIIIGCNIYISRESLYWAYAGILYIWGFNLTLIVIYYVYKFYISKKNMPIYLKIILVLLCIIQSFILETLSITIILFLILIVFFNIKNKTKNNFYIILLIITIISFLISAFAPGNFPRTIPLKDELQGFNLIQIILGKGHGLFTMIFHPNIYGFYIGILIILVIKNYLKEECKKFYYKIPVIFGLSYFFFVFIYKIFGFNILLFFQTRNIDVLQYYNENIFHLILIILYYILLVCSIFYMIYKTTFKKNKFFFFSIIISFISSIVPIIFIRYIGARYYLFFLINILIISLNYIIDLKKYKINIVDIICLIIISFSEISLLIILLIFLLRTIFSRKKNDFYKNSLMVIGCFILISIIINIVVVFKGYNYNNKIYEKNDQLLSNAHNINNHNGIVLLSEIPYKYSLYSWHSNVLDFNNYHIYYGFYLNEFYSEYYGFDMEKVRIIGINGNFY